jgi:hypothetical protein
MLGKNKSSICGTIQCGVTRQKSFRLLQAPGEARLALGMSASSDPRLAQTFADVARRVLTVSDVGDGSPSPFACFYERACVIAERPYPSDKTGVKLLMASGMQGESMSEAECIAMLNQLRAVQLPPGLAAWAHTMPLLDDLGSYGLIWQYMRLVRIRAADETKVVGSGVEPVERIGTHGSGSSKEDRDVARHAQCIAGAAPPTGGHRRMEEPSHDIPAARPSASRGPSGAATPNGGSPQEGAESRHTRDQTQCPQPGWGAAGGRWGALGAAWGRWGPMGAAGDASLSGAWVWN